MENQLRFEAGAEAVFTIADHGNIVPIVVPESVDQSVHIAVSTFADDIERVTGHKPDILSKRPSFEILVIELRIADQDDGDDEEIAGRLVGKWESFLIRVEGNGRTLAVIGSDKRGAIYGLYTLSEHMGVSPWYWWSDVPVTPRSTILFPLHSTYYHGPPAVKYRGLFLNDEQPVLWNWAREHFKTGNGPPFQVGLYEKVFELLLRLKGNYAWPAMWASMFAVDGLDNFDGEPIRGPNQVLANRMGIVMGTSHHEPMSRNQKEWTTWSKGPWDFEKNREELMEFWRVGAERAKGCETVFTVGMRGDGDLPLDGANKELLETITAVQQDILKASHGDIKDLPQLWAIYKEVMGYYATGLKVPDGEVTALLADDNWGNLMAVLPADRRKPKAGGIYYHADYVGDPRSYKWINTVSLAKMWEQLNVALSFKMDEIWILNVGDLKFLETPLEYFLSIAYDGQGIKRDCLISWLGAVASRDYGHEYANEIAQIMALYSMYASRRKAELLDSEVYSLTNYDEADGVLNQWQALEIRAEAVHDSLTSSKTAFYETILIQIRLQTNLHRLYNSAAKSNLYATQGRTAANVYAKDALDCFNQDNKLTSDFNKIEGGKWKHMLCQTHIGYQYWQMPVRNSMPPTSHIAPHEATFALGDHIHIRYTVENCLGAWPGDNQYNGPLGYSSPDPHLQPMDQFGKSRWVDVGSGGDQDVGFSTKASHEFVSVEPASGRIKGDGTSDTRVHISIDWSKAEGDEITVIFASDDKAPPMTVTIPLLNLLVPPDFHGAVTGDGYVALEAVHHQSTSDITYGGIQHYWAQIPYYGRTHSSMSIFPVLEKRLPVGSRPTMQYRFFAFDSGEFDLIFHIGPSLNYVLGDKLAFGYQVDDGDILEVEPIPSAPLGDLPHDWETVVANEIREVRRKITLGEGSVHILTVYGITSGVNIERVMIDFGGMAVRGHSYLGPPESVIV